MKPKEKKWARGELQIQNMLTATKIADKYCRQVQSDDIAQLKRSMLHHSGELTITTINGFTLVLQSRTIARMGRALLYATEDGCVVFQIVFWEYQDDDGLNQYRLLHTFFPAPSLTMWRSAASVMCG